MDSDDENPWGEEPAWAKDDQRDLEANKNNEHNGNGKGVATVLPWYNDFAEDGTVFGAQHVLVMIDCRSSMFVPCIPLPLSKSGKQRHDIMISPFDAAIMACEKLLRLRVHHVATSKTGKRDGVGILLYGTQPKQQGKNHTMSPKYAGRTNDVPNAKSKRKSDQGETNDDLGDDNSSSSSSSNDSDSETSDGENDESSFLAEPTTTTHVLVELCPPGIKQIKTVLECLDDHVRNQDRKRDLQDEYAATVLDDNTNDESEENPNNGNNNALDPSHVARKMGQSTLCPLRSALHEASKIFASAKCVNSKASTSKSPGDSKTVWIFTNEDDPCYGNEEESRLVVMVAKDAMANGIDIQVWPLPRPFSVNTVATSRQNHHPSSFRHDIFFHKISTKNSNSAVDDFSLDYSSQQQGGEQSNHTFDIDDMLEDIQRQWKKVRKAYSVPLFLPDWKDHSEDEYPGIQLDFFHIVQIQSKPTAVTIHQLTKKQTIKTSQYITKDTGEIMSGPRGHEPERKAVKEDNNNNGKKTKENSWKSGLSGKSTGDDRICSFFEFGGERVYMSKQEQQIVKSKSNAMDKPSLILLGFKSMNAIPMTHRISRSYIGYPNDSAVHGSKIAFAHLHAAMLRKNVLAIGELLVRSTATSRLVALYPQQEKREVIAEENDEDDESHQNNGMERQVVPPGLILVELPYEDDVRAAVDADTGQETKSDVASEALIEAATGLIRNQRLEGIEFGYDFSNYSLAKFASFLEAVALDIPEEKIENETAIDETTVENAVGSEIAAFQNALPEDVKVEKSRKRKVISDDSTHIDWVELYKADSLSDCTIDTLKIYLRSVGEKLSGRKSELILRVTQHIENELLQK